MEMACSVQLEFANPSDGIQFVMIRANAQMDKSCSGGG